MRKRKELAIMLMINLFVSSLAILGMSLIPASETHYVATPYSTTTYPNSDVASLWIRRNGTDPYPFDFYDGANVSPSYGMNYFGTNVIQVTWSYNWTDIANLALFPLDSSMYIQINQGMTYGPGNAQDVADHAVNDSRIKGAFIDDFEVGKQSPANMSAIHENLTHHNVNLTLGIIVYNRNYMNQNGYVAGYPYAWWEIATYIDIIHFWYYPFTYSLLYNGLIGYEDDFLALHSFMPTKEYWLGIYLHYYNIGSYELNFTAEQMVIAGKLIKQGYATRYSILENFWIQHHKQTALLVKNFINNELQMDYTTTWYLGTQTALSYTKGQPLFSKLISDVDRPMRYNEGDSFTFESYRLQNLTVIGAYIPSYEYTGDPFSPWRVIDTVWTSPTTDYLLWNTRTGEWTFPFYFDVLNETASYILEPEQTYRISERPLTPYTIWSNTTISTNTRWDNLLVTVYGMITVNNTAFTITNSIIQFGNPNTNNSMYHHTMPWYGLTIGTNNVKIYISDTIIEPTFRAYPYYFDRPYSAYDDDSVFYMTNSILAGYSYRFRPAGHVHIDNSTLFQVQPRYDDYPASIWLLTAPSVQNVVLLHFNDNLIWNYPAGGVVGLFLMPYNLYGGSHDTLWAGTLYLTIDELVALNISLDYRSTTSTFQFNRNTIIGGNYGLWIDITLSLPTLVINDFTSYAATSDDMFTTFRLDGSTEKRIQINTYTIFNWSVKSPITGPIFVMHYSSLRNGIYVLTTDLSSQNIAVSTGTLTLTFQEWATYRNNYTLTLFGISIDTGKTFTNLIWLIFIFIAPIGMAQVAPKIGFIFGMILMLLVVFIQDANFLPYMFVSMVAIVISVFKSR